MKKIIPLLLVSFLLNLNDANFSSANMEKKHSTPLYSYFDFGWQFEQQAPEHHRFELRDAEFQLHQKSEFSEFRFDIPLRTESSLVTTNDKTFVNQTVLFNFDEKGQIFYLKNFGKKWAIKTGKFDSFLNAENLDSNKRLFTMRSASHRYFIPTSELGAAIFYEPSAILKFMGSFGSTTNFLKKTTYSQYGVSLLAELDLNDSHFSFGGRTQSDIEGTQNFSHLLLFHGSTLLSDSTHLKFGLTRGLYSNLAQTNSLGLEVGLETKLFQIYQLGARWEWLMNKEGISGTNYSEATLNWSKVISESAKIKLEYVLEIEKTSTEIHFKSAHVGLIGLVAELN